MPAERGMSQRAKEGLVKKWFSEIDDAEKREKKFRQLGQEIVNLYEAKAPDETPFAILYSNTETLAPAVYNARPIPVVTRRYRDADPLGKAVSEVSTRILKFLIDKDSKDYDSYDELMQPAVLDGLITNRGLTRFRYVAENGGEAECAYGEAVRWDKFLHGYARTWKKVPWIAFEWDMSKDELKKNFKDAPIDYSKLTSREDDPDEKAESRDELTGVVTFKVYEIWDKETGKVIFVSRCCKEPLRYIDDPLKLSTFFPIPKPLNFMRKVTTLVPTPMYQQYRQQAAELNEITRRLKAIIRAIKFRGAYNSSIDGIEKMLEADDNVLVPVENMQSMPDGTKMDQILYVVPVQELAQTALQLYQQREQIKQVIYEITGISDILRGASVASETATAQNIKNQWGTLRLKKMQKEVQRYCRESLAIMLEIASAFEVETLRKMTGLPFPTAAEKQDVQAKLQQAKTAFEMQVQQAQATSQQPPQMPPVPPELEQLLQSPTWEEIIQVMQDDVALHYKVDIETNSTIDAEAAQDKQDIAELLNAISQFLNGVAPLVQQGVMPMEIAQSMLLIVARRFNFGTQLEDSLKLMKKPEPQEDPAAKEKAEQAKIEAQVAAQEGQMKMEQMKLDAQIAQQEHQNKMQLMQAEFAIEQQRLELAREQMEIDREMLASKAAFQREQSRIKTEQLKAKPKEPVNA